MKKDISSTNSYEDLELLKSENEHLREMLTSELIKRANNLEKIEQLMKENKYLHSLLADNKTIYNAAKIIPIRK